MTDTIDATDLNFNAGSGGLGLGVKPQWFDPGLLANYGLPSYPARQPAPAPQGPRPMPMDQGALAQTPPVDTQGALSSMFGGSPGVLGGNGTNMSTALQQLGAWAQVPNNPGAGASLLQTVGQPQQQQRQMQLQMMLGMKPQFLDGGQNWLTGQKNYLVGDPMTGSVRAAGALNQLNGGTGGNADAGMPGAQAFYDAVNEGKTPEELKSLVPKPIAPLVQQIVDGKLPPPTGASLKNPMIAGAFNIASHLGVDSANYAQRYKTAQDWATNGKDGQAFQALTAADEHMGQLFDKAMNLNNTQFPWLNSIKNYASDQLGKPEVRAFNATKNGVMSEVVKAYQNGHITDTQMHNFTAGLKDNGSPAQLIDVMYSFHDLMQARQHVMTQEYQQVMHKDVPYSTSHVYQDKVVAHATGQDQPGATTGAPAAGSALAQSAPAGPMTFSSPSDVAAAVKAGKLKSGDRFTSPDGKTRIVP